VDGRRLAVQTLQLQADKQPIKEIVPLPTTGWPTRGCSRKRLRIRNCAYKWMQYVTTPKPQAQQALVFGETPVNPLACPYMDKIQKGSCAAYHLNEPNSYYRQDQVLEDADHAVRLAEEQRLYGLTTPGSRRGRR
jgi:putative spermidine/putrescine transport system substrate-binding protein